MGLNWLRARGAAWAMVISLCVGQAHGQTTDPVKVEELKNRFHHGIELDNEGKLKEAREVFLNIIAEEPKAKGSLFYAAFTSLRLGEPDKASDYIERFRALAPEDFKGIVLAIQANQALRRTVKVDSLRKELIALRTTSNTPGLTDSKSYRREWILQENGGALMMMEFFDYKAEPYFLYQAESISSEGKLLRRMTVFYNAEETATTRAKNPKFAGVEIFDFSEEAIKDGLPVQLNVYRQEYEKPSYETARKWITEAIKSPPKPLQVVPLNQ